MCTNYKGNIVLINPPVQDFFQTTMRQEPLGLEYLAAVLQQKNYNVTLLDCLAEKKYKTINLPQELSYLSSYYPMHDLSPFKLYTHYRHFGLTFEDIKKNIIELKPDIIGISANFTAYFDITLQTAALCKAALPSIPIIIGGHHVTAIPRSALNTLFVDIVVLGEGEYTFLNLVETILEQNKVMLSTIPGIAFKHNNNIIINQPKNYIEKLDTLPYPAISAKRKFKMIITSRGCPKNCNFCSIDKVMGKKVRFRSIQSVLEEIEQARSQNIHHIDFEDDTLTINRTRTVELLDAIIKHFHGSGLTLSAMNGIDAETLDEEIIDKMKKAGFKWLNLPLVSGKYDVQKMVNRRQSITKFEKVINLAGKYGLKVIAYIILGLPEDNLEQMLTDIIFLAEKKVLIGSSIFYPPPGSATYENCLSHDYIKHDDYIRLRSSALPVETPDFNRNDLITLFRIVRMINYLKYHIDNFVTEDEILENYINRNVLHSDNNIFEHKIAPIEIGFILLHQLFANNTLKGFKLKTKREGLYYYEWLDYVHSPWLVTTFLRKFKNTSIRGTSSDFKLIRDCS